MLGKLLIISLLVTLSHFQTAHGWMKVNEKQYTIYYTKMDQPDLRDYKNLFSSSCLSIEKFFDQSIAKPFDIFIHPNRKSLDSSWQVQWNLPDFKSECWMVASGVGKQMDIISPRIWVKESCEHDYADRSATAKLIAHELCHVFHAQLNRSHDFNDVDNIDWFVEGLAVYASGQCDSLRMATIKQDVRNKTFPHTLNKFWMGPDKYGLSGSVVMFIDKKYGRAKLKELLPFNKKQEILSTLKIEESALISAWADFVSTNSSY